MSDTAADTAQPAADAAAPAVAETESTEPQQTDTTPAPAATTTDNNATQQHQDEPKPPATTESSDATTPAVNSTENHQHNDAAAAAAGENDVIAPATAASEDTAAAAAAPAPAVEATPPVEPRVVIVTGANTGLGLEVTKQLCDAGHDVILACRSEEKANRAIEKVRKLKPAAQATYMNLDLGSWDSIRKFVEEFRATGKKLSVLINNAGVAMGLKDTKRQYTKENIEVTIGTNHFGHFLLTHLLLNDLKETAKEGGDARIVLISSGMHDPELSKKRGPVQPLEMDNIFLYKEGTYSGLQAYKNSKLANLLFTYELSRQLDGTGVKVNAIDPGFVPTTELMRNGTSVQKFFARYVLHGMLRFTKQTRTASQAGNVICSVATADKFKETTGKYIRDGVEVKSSEESLDEAKQKKLWELTGGYLHLEGFEPLELPTPPPEPVKEEPKVEQKAEEAVVNGEASKPAAGDGDNKTATEESEKSEKPAETIEDSHTKVEESDNKTEEKKDAEKEENKE